MQAYNQKSLETLVYSIHWVFRTESKSFDRRFSAVQPLRVAFYACVSTDFPEQLNSLDGDSEFRLTSMPLSRIFY